MKSKQLYLIKTDNTNPYHNIALEKVLLEHAPKNSMTLYLWQNDRTVVIGSNQCAWRECNVPLLREDGGYLARRLSGGGAVYHDLGNLNFTYLYDKFMEDIHKQTSVIAQAVSSFGLDAQQSGRNDITVDGRKFSGNAYYTQGGRAYHHGTLLIKTDPEPLSKYLTTDEQKYRSKGVTSVRSRVVNLQDLSEEITVKSLSERLIKAFEEAYGAGAVWLTEEDLPKGEIEKAQDTLSQWSWVYGRPISFTWANEKRFPFGLLRLELDIHAGIIQDYALYSDAMQIELFPQLKESLVHQQASKDGITSALQNVKAPNELKAAFLELTDGSF
jgi:lipoate-protein ligase A